MPKKIKRNSPKKLSYKEIKICRNAYFFIGFLFAKKSNEKPFSFLFIYIINNFLFSFCFCLIKNTWKC